MKFLYNGDEYDTETMNFNDFIGDIVDTSDLEDYVNNEWGPIEIHNLYYTAYDLLNEYFESELDDILIEVVDDIADEFKSFIEDIEPGCHNFEDGCGIVDIDFEVLPEEDDGEFGIRYIGDVPLTEDSDAPERYSIDNLGDLIKRFPTDALLTGAYSVNIDAILYSKAQVDEFPKAPMPTVSPAKLLMCLLPEEAFLNLVTTLREGYAVRIKEIFEERVKTTKNTSYISTPLGAFEIARCDN